MRATPQTPQQYAAKNSKYLSKFTFKPHVFPQGFILKVDTREQHSPLFLDKPPKGLVIVRDTLKNGDYSFVGGEDRFCIEKKYAGDLLPYCSTEMEEKTKPKMQRFMDMISKGGWVGLVIEERMSDVFKWQEHTKISPESVRGALTKFAIDYGVHVHFAGNRENASRWILDHAIRYYNKMHEL